MSRSRSDIMSVARAALLAGVVFAVPFAGGGAFAQQPAAAADDQGTRDEPVQDIVVTGTLIRGIETPTGASLLSISRESIASTGVTAAKDLLNQTVPQLSTFNALPSGSADFGSAVSKISLRGIGSSTGLSSGTNATLVLFNGHRVVPVGILSTDPDPDLIPSDIIESVQVLPDGGSATYGSDAIGGVVNFVTRKKFDGIQLRGQHVFGESYHENTVTGVVGKSWSTGAAFVSGTFNKHSAIFGKDRDYITADFRSQGGVDRRASTCNYGNFALAGQNYTGNGFAAIPSATRCDQTDYTSLTPAEERKNVFGYVEQQLTDNLKFSVDAFWSDRSAKIYSDISNIGTNYTITNANPFFRPVGTETEQRVSVNYGRALGNNRETLQSYTQYQFSPNLTWTINDKWQARAEFIYGESVSVINDRTGVNGAAITATNFNPYDPSLTDAAVLRSLANYEIYSRGVNTLESGMLTVNGSLFDLPGGEVKVAFGGEIRRQSLLDETVTGAIGDHNALRSFYAARTVKAAFAELYVPVVGPENSMPGLREFSIDAAVRYDHYSDFGGTTNPRIGFDYRPIEDFVIRANYQTTFVAPSLADSGNQVDTRFQIQALTAAGANAYRVNIAGAGIGLNPQSGRTFSVGGEWAPKSVPGLRVSATYWNTKIDNIITQALSAFGSSALASGTQYNLCGTGDAGTGRQASSGGACTLAYLNSLQPIWLRVDNGAAPAIKNLSDLFQPGVRLIDVTDARRKNFGTAKLEGIDASASYNTDVSFGTMFFQVAGTYNLRRKIALVAGGSFTDYISGERVIGSPRYNIVASVGGTSGPVTLRGNVRRNGGYGIPVNNSPGQARVSSYTLVDFYAGVDLGKFTEIKNTKLEFVLNNLFNQDPPYYGGDISANRPGGYANGGTLGRTLAVGLTTKF